MKRLSDNFTERGENEKVNTLFCFGLFHFLADMAATHLTKIWTILAAGITKVPPLSGFLWPHDCSFHS